MIAALRLSLLGLLASVTAALAQVPPTIKIIVPVPPGGAIDILARLIGDEIKRSGGPTIVVENRSGANNLIGNTATARALPDGTTVGMVSPALIINARIRNVDDVRLANFEPICHLVDSPQVVAVRADGPYKSMADLVDAARRSQGRFSVGALGPLSVLQIAIELLKKNTGVPMSYVAYPGGAASANALSGKEIEAVFINFSEVLPKVTAGELRVLMTMSPQRLAPLPDVPTAQELGYNFDITGWFALVAPARTPSPVTVELGKLFANALNQPALKKRLEDLHMLPVIQCGEPARQFLQTQDQIIGDIIRDANIKVD
jgi:tripartite-type tricarboxylate transporter receptor subunit TctC